MRNGSARRVAVSGLLTSLIVNNGKIGTGTDEEDGLSAAAEEMGKVDFSKIGEEKK